MDKKFDSIKQLRFISPINAVFRHLISILKTEIKLWAFKSRLMHSLLLGHRMNGFLFFSDFQLGTIAIEVIWYLNFTGCPFETYFEVHFAVIVDRIRRSRMSQRSEWYGWINRYWFHMSRNLGRWNDALR